MGRAIDTHRSQANPPNPELRTISSARSGCISKILSLKIVLVVVLILGILLYVVTAPPIEAPKEPPKLEFHGRAALRRRPSLESAPIAYTQNGTRLEILDSEGDWVRVRIEGTITGWTQRNEGTVILPPPPKLTMRQRAKQRLLKLVNQLREIIHY